MHGGAALATKACIMRGLAPGWAGSFMAVSKYSVGGSDLTIDSIFINGTVGVGKSTLADALSLIEHGPHAVIDLDSIRRLVPSPTLDPFTHEIELKNLRSIAHNYRSSGARRFILAGVIESSTEVKRYQDALGSSGILFCRLVADPKDIDARLRKRHCEDAESLAWHLARTGELAETLEQNSFEHILLNSSRGSPSQLADSVRQAAGWD